MNKPDIISWINVWQPKPTIKDKTPNPATIEATSTPQIVKMIAKSANIAIYFNKLLVKELIVLPWLSVWEL